MSQAVRIGSPSGDTSSPEYDKEELGEDEERIEEEEEEGEGEVEEVAACRVLGAGARCIACGME